MDFSEEFLPVFDASDELAVVVDADQRTTWNALLEVDFLKVGKQHPIAAVLGAVRVLPDIAVGLIHGKTPEPPPERLQLGELGKLDMGDGGWVELGRRDGSEIALGLVGKFWKPVIEYAQVAPEDFKSFDEPDFARTVYAFQLKPIEDARTLLTATMRTATTDEHARKWFRRYWTIGVGSGAHVLVNGLLEMVRETAETSGDRPDEVQTAAD